MAVTWNQITREDWRGKEPLSKEYPTITMMLKGSELT